MEAAFYQASAGRGAACGGGLGAFGGGWGAASRGRRARDDAAFAFVPECMPASPLETMMKNYEYQSDFAKKYVAQGRAEEAGRAVLTALRVRGIVVPAADRERILAEKDPAKLERWHERAILATSIGEVLDESNEAA